MGLNLLGRAVVLMLFVEVATCLGLTRVRGPVPTLISDYIAKASLISLPTNVRECKAGKGKGSLLGRKHVA